MDRLALIQSADDLIQLFLRAKDRSESDSLLSRVILEHAEPIITGIIKNNLRVSLNNSEGSGQNQDALEIAGDVRAAILAELEGLKNGAQGKLINNFHNYVAVKTYSACADYFRTKNPQRRRLKDMLRYNLKQSRRFSLWEDGDKRWICGLRNWQGAGLHLSHSDQLQKLLSEPQSILTNSQLSAAKSQQTQPTDLLTAIFECVGHPIEFNQLVTIVADAWDIRDQPTESYNHDARASENLIDSATGVDTVVEQRLYLQRLWTEVTHLPALQRSALLLNLRDVQGGSAIAFVPHLGIASKAEIAEVLSMSAEQFSNLWNKLPLDDASIAQLLGVTRQQVINLRKTARERLARRMSTLEKNSGSNK